MAGPVVLSLDEVLALARATPQARLLGLIADVQDRTSAARVERGRRLLGERDLGDALGSLAQPDLVVRVTHRRGSVVETRGYVASGDSWDELQKADGDFELSRGRGRWLDALLAFADLSRDGAAGEGFVTSLAALNRAAADAGPVPAGADALVRALGTRATATEVASLHWEGRRLVGGELSWIDGAGTGIWVLEPEEAGELEREPPVRVDPVTRQELLRRLFSYLPGAPIGSS